METLVGSYPSQTGQQIFYHIWIPKQPAKAVLQIIHGMAEYSARYREFAEFLCKHGYIVAAEDHPGHGKTAKQSGKYGYFDEKEGWNKVTQDLLRFNQQLHDVYKLPVFVLGHSMGSFFARTLMIRNPEVAKFWIICGTGNFLVLERYLGFALANFSLFFKNPDAPAGFMHSISFGAYNKEFKDENSELAWLSSNKEIVQAYEKDPFCGGVFSCAFYRDLMYGIDFIHTRRNLKEIPKNTRIAIFSGLEDPVGNYGKGVTKVYNRFLDLGLKVNMKLYPGMRHEILNEIDKEKVYQDICDSMESEMTRIQNND